MSPNGTDGYYLFPVNPRIAYVIRDNKQCPDVCDKCRDRMLRYDLFVITGNNPTLNDHELSVLVTSSKSYTECCTEIEIVSERASRLAVSVQ